MKEQKTDEKSPRQPEYENEVSPDTPHDPIEPDPMNPVVPEAPQDEEEPETERSSKDGNKRKPTEIV
jgi:hypothetical protein